MTSMKIVFFMILVVGSLAFLFLHNGSHVRTSESFHFLFSTSRVIREKHTAIIFLKTHKTASSTVQNILFRFAEKHNVTVALPVQDYDHTFCYPKKFLVQFAHPCTSLPHIVTNHMRFDFKELQLLMPENTIYVTLLREPVALFESLFTYFHEVSLSFNQVPANSMETFLNNPLKYYKANDILAHNTLVFDLGGDNNHNATDEKYIESFIKEIDGIFSLVMIAEYFEESLILLKHLMNWELQDILSVNHNMRSKDSKLNITSNISQKVQSWNALDTKLYNYFNKTFWNKLQEFGLQRMKKEIQLLRQAHEKLFQESFGGRPKPLPIKQIKNVNLHPVQPRLNVNILGYDFSANNISAISNNCLKLVLPEVNYVNHLKNKYLSCHIKDN